MDLRRAYDLASGLRQDLGRFYGPFEGLDLGAGLILKDVAYPLYDVEESDFAVVTGLAYVVSHECDMDQANIRPFNDYGVICPIIPLQAVLERLLQAMAEEQIVSFLGAVGRRAVERVLFVPAIHDVLPEGGIMYLGALTSTHVTELQRDGVSTCGAVSVYGLRAIDYALEQAFRKPKAQRLAFAQGD